MRDDRAPHYDLCPLDRIAAVITDDEENAGAYAELDDCGVELLLASGARQPPEEGSSGGHNCPA